MLNKPKKIKYTYHHNLKIPSAFKTHNNLIKQQVALISMQNGIITAAQINSAILSIKRKLKDTSSFLIRVFPHLPVTKRPLEMPLGRGKASVSYWASTIKAGSIIFELKTDQPLLTIKALKAGSAKFSLRTKIVNKLMP